MRRTGSSLLNSHLPERYRASSAFIVDSDGRRSRQIDIAIYDRFYSPLIFPYESGYLVPAESVYAIVEVKQVLTRQYVRDVGRKIGSVRRLHRTSVPVPYAGGSIPPRSPTGSSESWPPPALSGEGPSART